MRIKFYGADKMVTGSCHMIEINGKKYLLDCGMSQGADAKINKNEIPFNPTDIEAVIISHAHIDHSGLIPLLVKRGYRGNIYANTKTLELLNIMLRDSAHIQEMEVIWQNRKKKREDKEEKEALYDMNDVEKALDLMLPLPYNYKFDIGEGVKVRLINSGHLLGASSIELFLTEGDIEKKVVFSGDIGNKNIPIIKDPTYIEEADIVLMETTYGDKLHDSNLNYVEVLADIFEKTFERGGNVVIPSFAVGRTQEILYYIREIKEKRLVKNLPDFKVYIDSPLAGNATRIYDDDMEDYCDKETMDVLYSGVNPILFDDLVITESAEESIAINFDSEPKVIISSSGMCDAGRIRHHLKHNLWRKDSSIIFVGFQANGTLGRIIVDGAEEVKLFGEKIAIKADIINLKGLSGHADRNGLYEWISNIKNDIQKVFLVHGEIKSMSSFDELLRANNYKTYLPNFDCEYDIIEDRIISEGIDKDKELQKDYSKAYMELLETYKKLDAIKLKFSHLSNKDIKKLEKDIEELVRKYED